MQGTELFQAEIEGNIGISPLLFMQFPYTTIATTYSATNSVTDSAASGTALATGKKTQNGTLGLLKDEKTMVSSIATWAKNAGHKVGIATSVSVNHATPAAFYAHSSDVLNPKLPLQLYSNRINTFWVKEAITTAYHRL